MESFNIPQTFIENPNILSSTLYNSNNNIQSNNLQNSNKFNLNKSQFQQPQTSRSLFSSKKITIIFKLKPKIIIIHSFI